ncbi:MAG: hypothetical protein ABIJ45_04520 [Candidatus Zixiibacteriota bacterium]
MGIKRIIAIFTIILLFGVASVSLGSTINYLTDIKAVYLYDGFENIDWALVYYLSVDNGCLVELVSIGPGPMYKQMETAAERYSLTARRFFIPSISNEYYETISKELFRDFAPDIFIFGSNYVSEEPKGYESFISDYVGDTTGNNQIKKFYKRSSAGTDQSIYLKSKQFFDNYYDEIASMSKAIFSRPPLVKTDEIYTMYDLVKGRIITTGGRASFLNGIQRFKFDQVISAHISNTAYQMQLKKNRKDYINYLDDAISKTGQERLNALLSARDELKNILAIYYRQINTIDTLSPVSRYISSRLKALSKAIFFETGISHNSQVVIRETPEGKRLKLRTEINNDGLLPVVGGYLTFKPYWTDQEIAIDTNCVEIQPNNSLIREYTVIIDQQKLETISEELLVFIGRVEYMNYVVDFNYQTSSYENTGFGVEFVPDFLLIKPFNKLKIDKLVEQAALKAVITKPPGFTGRININVTTSKNILAGAYPERLDLTAEERAIEINIPIVATKSMEDRVHEISISISSGGSQLASDIAYIRTGEIKISDDKYFGLLPDKDGLIEDIFIQSGINYKIISDRFLKSGNFNLFDAVIFGTGCIQAYSSLNMIYDKTKNYVEQGGKVIVFGQSDEWRDDLLPVSLISSARGINYDEIKINSASHAVFSTGASVTISELLKNATQNYITYPAVAFPCQKIIEANNNTSLLSVSKFGKGEIIYCGLPIPEQVSDLDLEAIKFFANLINF